MPVALAQFLHYNRPNTTITVDDKIISTMYLSSLEYGSAAHHFMADMIASELLYNIGLLVDADYDLGDEDTPPSTSATMSDAASFLRGCNFNASYVSFNEGSVFAHLYNNKPVLVRGEEDGEEVGHTWIIDGGYHYTVSGTRFTIDGGAEEVTVEHKMLHCNYGWGGVCDGYYEPGVFGTNNLFREPSIGDILVNGEYIYDTDLRMVTY